MTCRHFHREPLHRRRLSRFAASAAWIIGLTSAWGLLAAGHPRDAEHQRIASERAAAKARFVERERECNKQFVVTSCVNAARQEQRAVLTRLRHEELELDDAQRREVAENLLQAQAGKTAKQAVPGEATASAPSSQPRDNGRRAPVPNPESSRASGNGFGLKARSSQPAAAQQASEAQHQAGFDAKAQAAAAHREAIERRNAERAASGKAAKPLPVPSSASAASQ